MTPMSSQACWSAGGRNAPDVANSRRPPPSCAWTLLKIRRLAPNGQVPGDAAHPVERRRLALLRDLALDGAPEQVHQLRDEEHGGDAVLAQAVEDHARVPAAEVEDVRPDIHAVEQGDLLLKAVRQGEQRDQPVLHRLDDPVERHRARERVAVGEHHALGAAGRPAREHELVDVVRLRALPGVELRLPISGERLVRVIGQAVHDAGREPLQADLARVRGIPAAAEQQADRARGLDDVGDGVRAHARIERHIDQPRHHRAEVGRRQGGRGR